MQTSPRELATVCSYRELLAVLRARADELQITRETIDAASGLQSGYSAKLLTNQPIRSFGSVSLGAVLGVLGLKLVVVEDRAAMANQSVQLVKRTRLLRTKSG